MKVLALLVVLLVVRGQESFIDDSLELEDLEGAKAHCVGDIHPVKGLIPWRNQTLLSWALGTPGNGGLCKGKVYKVVKPIPVYRVYNAAESWSQFGGWWSFEIPKPPKVIYRIQNEICPEWSPLDIVTACYIKLGTQIVVGTGQSANCENNVTLPISPVNQVYIPNNDEENIILVEDCTPGIPWPLSWDE